MAYSRFVEEKSLPETERLWKQVLSLPFRYPLSEKEIVKISDLVNNFYGY